VSQEIIAYVQREYGMLATVGPFEIYKAR
jgi:hypothetical protein